MDEQKEWNQKASQLFDVLQEQININRQNLDTLKSMNEALLKGMGAQADIILNLNERIEKLESIITQQAESN